MTIKVSNTTGTQISVIDAKSTQKNRAAGSFDSMLQKLSPQTSIHSPEIQRLADDLSHGRIDKEQAVSNFVNIIVNDMNLPTSGAMKDQIQQSISNMLNSEPDFGDKLQKHLMKLHSPHTVGRGIKGEGQ